MDLRKVDFYSRSFVKKLFVNQDEDPFEKEIAVISINDTTDELKEMVPMIEDHPYIALKFADTNNDKSISPAQTKDLLSFINSHKEKTFIVHCWAGISRSAAVAKFINEHLEVNDDYLNGYSLYNRWVYNSLNAAAGKSLAAYYENLELQDRLNPKG